MLFLYHFQLKKLTKSPYVFLVPILHSSEEGLIQVINDNVLDKEIRFSVSNRFGLRITWLFIEPSRPGCHLHYLVYTLPAI